MWVRINDNSVFLFLEQTLILSRDQGVFIVIRYKLILGLLELRLLFETRLRLAGVNDHIILLLYLDSFVVVRRGLLLLALSKVMIRYYRFLVVQWWFGRILGLRRNNCSQIFCTALRDNFASSFTIGRLDSNEGISIGDISP